MMNNWSFIHCGNNPPSKETFKDTNCRDKNMFNIPIDCFFLSRKIKETSIDNKSYWIKHCEDKQDDKNNYSFWVNAKKTVYKLLPNAKILVINSENILNFYRKYGTYIPPIDRFMSKKKKIMAEIRELLEFINTFKYKYNNDDKELFIKTIKKYNGKIPFKINRDKKAFKDWCHVISRLYFLYNELYNYDIVYRYSSDETIQNEIYGYYDLDYEKIKKDYDGVYYPIHLFKDKYRYTHDSLFIRMALNALGTDTLIIFNWCFL